MEGQAPNIGYAGHCACLKCHPTWWNLPVNRPNDMLTSIPAMPGFFLLVIACLLQMPLSWWSSYQLFCPSKEIPPVQSPVMDYRSGSNWDNHILVSAITLPTPLAVCFKHDIIIKAFSFWWKSETLAHCQLWWYSFSSLTYGRNIELRYLSTKWIFPRSLPEFVQELNREYA